MSEAQVGSFLVVLFVLLALAHLMGYLFERLRQPRVVGEIVAGILVGPSLLGHLAPRVSATIFSELGPATAASGHNAQLLGMVYWLGLLLLMFVSGAEVRNLFCREDQRQIGWLASVGTGLPFLLVMLASPWLPLQALMGRANQHLALLLVISIAVAVTSIPVISRIFFDLKILHTRFARLVLGVAVIEDTVLWAALAIATALATSAVLPRPEIVKHIVYTVIYFGIGLSVAPVLFRRVSGVWWNLLAASSPLGYVVLVLFTYCVVASRLQVSLVFAAFLAGLAIPSDSTFSEALDSIKRFSFAVFVPVYFAIVGFKLDLSKSFSLSVLAVLLLAGCAVKLLCVGAGARLAGFRGLDIVNLAVATNARGGPGIVLASVAFDTGIVNAVGYTSLVLLAVLTSQAAGTWLEYVLRKGWPLLSSDTETATQPAMAPAPGIRFHD
ncbi:MAG TPA: cation:proton antiporter [Terriglobales bacterium]|nr:cation:proton antiporter [Terriglobales bacterium]